jgi:Fur family transcriptional regulator, peroxide stress response regulator
VGVNAAEIERRVERLRSAFREAGVKLTHQRLEIFREMASSLDHPTADVVFRAVKGRLPTVSIDTVYRTLWILNDLGLVATLGPRKEGIRFDPNLERHHHYVCVRCGLVRDFDDARLRGLRAPAAVRGFGSVQSIQIEVRGLCRRCSTTKTASSNRRKP